MTSSGGHSQWSGGAGHRRRSRPLHSQPGRRKAPGFHCKIQVSSQLWQNTTDLWSQALKYNTVSVTAASYNPYDGPNDNPEVELPLTAGEYIYVYGDMDDDGFYEGEAGLDFCLSTHTVPTYCYSALQVGSTNKQPDYLLFSQRFTKHISVPSNLSIGKILLLLYKLGAKWLICLMLLAWRRSMSTMQLCFSIWKFRVPQLGVTVTLFCHILIFFCKIINSCCDSLITKNIFLTFAKLYFRSLTFLLLPE